MKIRDMEPGMVFADHIIGKRFIYVGQIGVHPLWTHLALVIWREVVTPDDKDRNPDHPLGWNVGEWYHDALSPDMEMMGVLLPEPEGVFDKAMRREENLRLALLNLSGRQ